VLVPTKLVRSRKGFDLPAPKQDTSGGDDKPEWRCNPPRTPIDTSERQWNQAMFVTCAPRASGSTRLKGD